MLKYRHWREFHPIRWCLCIEMMILYQPNSFSDLLWISNHDKVPDDSERRYTSRNQLPLFFHFSINCLSLYALFAFYIDIWQLQLLYFPCMVLKKQDNMYKMYETFIWCYRNNKKKVSRLITFPMIASFRRWNSHV